MKNPFKKKENNSGLIVGFTLGAITAASLIYIYLKKRAALKAAEEERKLHAKDYLNPKPLKKKQTTDIHELEKIIGN